MQEQDDGLQAQAVAGRIVSAGDRKDLPSPDDLHLLANLIESRSSEVADKLRLLGEKGDEVSVQDMFEMQMLMNHFSQLSEMNSSVISAANAAITSMARNVKG